MPDDPKPTSAGIITADDLLLALLIVRDTMLAERPAGQKWDWGNDIETVLSAQLYMEGYDTSTALAAIRQPAVRSEDQTNAICARLGLPPKYPRREGTWRDLLTGQRVAVVVKQRWAAFTDEELEVMVARLQDHKLSSKDGVALAELVVEAVEEVKRRRHQAAVDATVAAAPRRYAADVMPDGEPVAVNVETLKIAADMSPAEEKRDHEARALRVLAWSIRRGEAERDPRILCPVTHDGRWCGLTSGHHGRCHFTRTSPQGGIDALCGRAYEHASGFVEYCWREPKTCEIIGHGDWRAYRPGHTHDEEPEGRCHACAKLGLYARDWTSP